MSAACAWPGLFVYGLSVTISFMHMMATTYAVDASMNRHVGPVC